MKCIILARHSTPDEVIAALRPQVFGCFTPPFDAVGIANLACRAASDSQWREDIQVLSATPGWVSVRVNCPLKLLSPEMAADPQAREGLRREARAAAALDHPFICNIFEIPGSRKK